ncbi:BZIP transcription factor [Colletotrichum tofieldiae]|uniref:BZIP transcription factor n=1 Tax=Colletotrichum tofieldiae TaxID=708197 RepID=A0A166LED0_9PEZI|nr:bZIP transcription factor [Colletotrichum tofieldiae]GKT53380.1 bZIP transcription factor [Colletotrichum tofieldiae]GKT73137.1 BZIP transcription factor [Colletotrichum tofieldiae]GKT88194.1 BZIP transcription factor [Colletotrichum tofieldiae]
MSIDNKDPVKEDTPETTGSSPEADQPGAANGTSNNAGAATENQQPKRKGGRKPIYATSEERKQRNRQAQAAFRERRTEYIKQLEEAIRVHESNLHNLQAAHRTAADECLMLRYKNSLLERIDVQAELRAKTGSPNLGPTHAPQNMVQPPPIQRAILNRHHQSRRSNSSIAPKLEPGISSLPPPIQAAHSAASPKGRPTPSSHSNSPTNTAAYGSQPALSPAASDHGPLRAGMAPSMKSQLSPMGPMNPAARAHMMSGGPPRVGNNGSYYPTPAFQNHIEQLEQEYDAPADMIEDSEIDTPSGPGPYPSGFSGDAPQQMMPSPNSVGPGQHMTSQGESAQPAHTTQGAYPSMTQLLDTGIDWDPFGLSASMAFPSQFSFDTSNMR